MSIKRLILRKIVTEIILPKWARPKKSRKKIVGAALIGVGTALTVKKVLRELTAYDLRNKTVLITGGSRGLGLVLSREFLREGARVAICARNAEELELAKQDLQQISSNVLTVTCDITRQNEVAEMVSRVREQFGQIDVLVNNAGTISVAPLEEMTLNDFEEAMQINYQGALYTSLAVIPEMRARQNGRIVNIASIGGKLSVPHLLPYSASKFALVGFSEGLRAELMKDGITVTTVCPGLMRTGSPRNANFKGQYQAEYAWFSIADSLPLLSISAERAARQIISACKHGDAELVITMPAKLATIFHGLFPGLTADMMGLANRFLPAPGGIGERSAKGSESNSELSPSWLTTLSDEAAKSNNQIH